jgi:hypothetical protein
MASLKVLYIITVSREHAFSKSAQKQYLSKPAPKRQANLTLSGATTFHCLYNGSLSTYAAVPIPYTRRKVTELKQ